MKQPISSLIQRIDNVYNNSSLCIKLKNYFFQFFPFLTVCFITLLMSITLYTLWQDRAAINSHTLFDDLDHLSDIFSTIDKKCSIISVNQERNLIDFLNVEHINEQTIGSLSIKNQEGWEGPYASENPTFQGKLYEIVQAKDGIFIVPGYDVLLPNKKRMGFDIIIDANTEVEPLIQNGGALFFDGKSCARKIKGSSIDVNTEPSMKEIVL